VITIAHTATVPPEVSGFILHDDNVVIPPRSGIRLRVLPPAARFDIDDVPAAAEESEQPVPERGAEVDNNEVVIDGVKLDSNSPLKTLAAACESLGISRRGGKAKCLERLWDHFQTQELIAAHGAQHQLRGDLARPVHYQSVLAEPREKRIADHNLVHQFFAAWCEVCIANKSQQEGHPARQGEPAGAHTCVSFYFGFASRTEHEPKVCGPFVHDHYSGAKTCDKILHAPKGSYAIRSRTSTSSSKSPMLGPGAS